MYLPKTIYTEIALKSIKEFLETGKTTGVEKETIPVELFEKKACFVSLHIAKNDDLRGCIGTIEPVRENLFYEIIRNAVSSATRDSRFNSLKIDELDSIKLSVDVLSVPEKTTDLSNHNPKTHGLIISDGNYRRGVLLPNLEGIDTAEEQINIVMRKAGIYANDANLEYYTFTVERFH